MCVYRGGASNASQVRLSDWARGVSKTDRWREAWTTSVMRDCGDFQVAKASCQMVGFKHLQLKGGESLQPA